MTIIQIQTKVFCTLEIEGTHNWPECPFEEVAYLKDEHRHMFHIKAIKLVTHMDRDTEFIILKHDIINYLYSKYYTHHNNSQDLHIFGSKSCEMIAYELINEFDLCECEISEDGESGAIVTSTQVLNPIH